MSGERLGLEWAAPVAADAVRHAPAAVFAAGLRNHHISNTAYPIRHDLTWGPYRVPRAAHAEVVPRAFQGIDELCLYVHIPFCETRCSFCEYTVVKPEEAREPRPHVLDIVRELELHGALLGRRRLAGLDVGGGTPSFVDAELIGEILATARRCFELLPDVEISIETTPRIAASAPAKLQAYRRQGIGRISMGIQVIQPDLLRVLNRDKNGVEEHRRAVEHIRAAGFEKLNVDLMYGFAGQTLESWRATLEHAIRLGPEAITLYRMRYKLTRISHQAAEVTLDVVRPMVKLAKSMLADAGYEANPGKTTYSRIPGDTGTSSYLTRRVIDGMPYLGVGLGAQSFTHTTISYNDGAVGKNLAPYRRSLAEGRLPLQDLYHLPRRHMMAKMCAVSFYFGEIDRPSFQRKFGEPLEAVFGAEIDFLLARGLMELSPRALSLTPEGALHLNGVIALFFAPSVQGYLLARDPLQADDMHRNRRAAVKVASA